MSILDNVAGLVSNVAGALLFSPAVLVSRGAAARDGRGGFTYIDVITEIKALISENDTGNEGGGPTTSSDRVAIMVPLHGVPTEIKTGAYIALNNIAYNVVSIETDAADAVATCVCDRAGIAIGQGLDIEIILGAGGNVDGSANARLVQVLQNIVTNSDLTRGDASATAAIVLDSIIIAAVGTVAVPAQLHAGAIATLENVGQVETVQMRVRSGAVAVNTLQNVNQAIFGSLQDSAFSSLTQTLSPVASTTDATVEINANTASQLGQVTSTTDTDVGNASYVAALLTPLVFTANASLEGELSLNTTLEVVTSTTEATAEATSDNFNALGSIGIAASATAPVAGSVSQTLQTAIGVNDLDLIGVGSAGLTLGDVNITADASVITLSSTEPETDALLDEFVVPASDNHAYAINELIKALKAAGSWDKMDGFYTARQAEEQQTLINWKDPTGTQLTPGAGNTFTSNEYWERNGSAGSNVDTGFVPNTDGVQWTSSSAHVGIYATPTSFRQLWTDGFTGELIPTGGTNLRGEIGNQSVDIAFDSFTKSRGHFIMSGEFPGTMHTYKDGVQGGSPLATDAVLNSSTGTVKMLSMAPPSGALHRWSTFHFGANLTATEAAATYAAIVTYYDTLDNPVIIYPINFEQEAIDYLTAMPVAPDEDRQAIINDLFVDLKAAGVLSKMSILYLLRAHDIDASQINAANPGVNDNTVALSVWTEDEGVFRTSTANTTVAYRDMFDTTPNRFAIGVMIGPNSTGNGDFVGIGSSREIRRNNANGIYSRAAGPELISGIDTPGVTTAITEALSGVADTALIIDDATVVTTGSASLVPGNDSLFRFGDGGQQYAVWACETLTEVEVYALHAALHRYNNAIDHMRGTSPQAADYFNRVAAKTTPFTDDRKATLNTFFDTLNAAGLADRGNAWYAPQHDDLSSQENWFRDQAHAVPVTAGATVDYDTAFVSTATSGDDWQFLDPQIHADQDYWCLGFQLDEPWRNWQTVMARGWDERYGTQQYDGGSNIFEMRLSNGYIQTTPPQYANCCMTRNSSYEEAFVNGVTAGMRTGVAAPSNDTNQGFIKAPNNSSSAHRRFACVYSFDHITEAEALIIHNAWEQYKLDKANEGSGSLAYQVIQTAQAVGDPALLLLPSAPTAGNLLIAVSGHRETETSSNFTGSSGWTEILTEHAYPTNSIHRRAMALYYKISDGTETSFHSFDFGGAGNLAGLVELSVTPDVDGLHGYQYDPGTTSLESSQSTGVLTGLPQGNYLLIAAVYARELMGAGTTLDNGFDNLDAYFETALAPAQSLGLSFQPVNTSGSVETTVSYAADVRGLAAIAALPL